MVINKAPITQNIIMPLSMYIYCISTGNQSRSYFCTLFDINGYEWSFATYLGDDSNMATKR